MEAGWSAAICAMPEFVGGFSQARRAFTRPGWCESHRPQSDRPPPGLGGGRSLVGGGQKVIESSALTFVGWRGW
ncbi:hypothetical protein GCM10009566_45070 [Streptomyces murinus]|uniref:Uncharacterized protein n=1 Tax=Streptomyces murinus TaxID=33900 RepID=A0A7W3RLT6_STRMR|nr:hypothetical protein [Streptomyces murinus]